MVRILLGAILALGGIAILFAMTARLVETNLWLSLTAYSASFSGVLLIAFTIARTRRGGD